MQKTLNQTEKFIAENGKFRGMLLWVTGRSYPKPKPPPKPIEAASGAIYTGHINFSSGIPKRYWKCSLGDTCIFLCYAPNFFNRFMIKLILGIHITPA